MRRWSTAIVLVAIAAALSARLATAQSPSRAVPEALQALTGGKYGCWTPMEIRDTTIGYFPGVRFIRGYCTGEHGDPKSGIVAIDGDSVLYLFSSQEALDFLLLRHHIPPLDSTTVLAYSAVALELTGHANAYSRRITAADSASPALRRALRWLRGRSASIIPMGQPNPVEWQVHFGRSEPGFDRRYEYVTEVWIGRDGRATVMKDSLVTALPVH